jgi:hypothetical protein
LREVEGAVEATGELHTQQGGRCESGGGNDRETYLRDVDVETAAVENQMIIG